MHPCLRRIEEATDPSALPLKSMDDEKVTGWAPAGAGNSLLCSL